MVGFTPLLRAIDAVELGRQVVATHGSLRGSRLYPAGAQMSGEFLSPFPKSGLADIETHALLAHSLHDHMHMRMRLISVKHHRVSVFQSELLPREVLDYL